MNRRTDYRSCIDECMRMSYNGEIKTGLLLLVVYTACLPKVVRIVNKTEGLSSRCVHLWASHRQRVSLDACVTEAFAERGNAINHDPDRLRCNVKHCRPATTGKLRLNDVMYDVIGNTSDVTTALDYRLTNVHGGWDVYAIIRQFSFEL